MRFNPEFKSEPTPETDFATVQREVGAALLTLEGARQSLEDIERDLRDIGDDEPGKAELEVARASLMRRLDAEQADLHGLLNRAQTLTS